MEREDRFLLLKIQHLCKQITARYDEVAFVGWYESLAKQLKALLPPTPGSVAETFWRHTCDARYPGLKIANFQERARDLHTLVEWASAPEADDTLRNQAHNVCEALMSACVKVLGPREPEAKPGPIFFTRLGRPRLILI